MSKFKIGDEVRVICNASSDLDGVEIGDIGIVVGIETNKDEEFPIGLRISKHNKYWFKEEELELVTDNNDFKLETKNNTYSLGEYPIGVVPQDIWLKKRKQEILDAIIRYAEAEIVIPVEWAKELKELEMRGV
mgnify:CR=1 FL=1